MSRSLGDPQAGCVWCQGYFASQQAAVAEAVPDQAAVEESDGDDDAAAGAATPDPLNPGTGSPAVNVPPNCIYKPKVIVLVSKQSTLTCSSHVHRAA